MYGCKKRQKCNLLFDGRVFVGVGVNECMDAWMYEATKQEPFCLVAFWGGGVNELMHGWIYEATNNILFDGCVFGGWSERVNA